MTKTKNQLISDIRKVVSSLDPYDTSSRLNSAAYSLMDLLIRLNTIDPGFCRNQIVELSLTIDREVRNAFDLAKERYISNPVITEDPDLIAARKAAIAKIHLNLSSLL